MRERAIGRFIIYQSRQLARTRWAGTAWMDEHYAARERWFAARRAYIDALRIEEIKLP